MLQWRKGSWMLYPYKVHYRQHGEPVTQWALPNKEWWTDFEKKWDYTTINEFEEIEITEEMNARYEEVKNMPESFGDVYREYVFSGDTQLDVDIPTYHPFNIIRLRKKDEKLNNEINNAVMELTMLMATGGGAGV